MVVAAGAQAGGGPVGLLIFLGLAVVTALLIRSMTKHLRRVPPSFETDSNEQGNAGPDDRPAPDRPR